MLRRGDTTITFTSLHAASYIAKYYWASIICLFISAWIIQSHLFINWDVSWLTHLAQRLCSEGINKDNFFEINTPMSIYIYMPAVIMAKVFYLDPPQAIRLSVLAVAGSVLFICSRLLRVLPSRRPLMTQNVLFSLAFVFLILPANQFGQREHIFCLLFMPYLLLTSLRLCHARVQVSFALFIGLLAAIGLAIKPYFLAPFILIEGFLLLKNKSLSLFRPETITILLLLLLYMISITQLQPGYVNQLLPLAIQSYYSGFHTPILFFFYDTLLLFCGSAIVIYGWQYKSDKSPLSIILLLALIGLLITYLAQGIASFVRILPAVSIAILLLTSLLCSQMTDTLQNGSSKLSVCLLFTVVGSIFFSIPLHAIITMTHASLKVRSHGSLNELIQFMNAQPPYQSFYFMTTSPPNLISDYLTDKHAKNVTELSLPYWILSGSLMRQQATNDPHEIETLKQYEALFIHSVVTTLDTEKPDIIFVDNRIVFNLLYHAFDYIHYFYQSEQFREIWKQYGYGGHVYNFDIYTRKLAAS